ncbi:hypothetical protein POM88_015408 [Heracleum sosnowskyi]|uniref:Uncharacterized protein n=1 Tax=Heracleum sosnowskyi TaxID=360622 RepID=A0AAD8IK55_9APIA|nr:hypothetical protein POM88_015408 [Heracleum sosnowskyi]
MAWCQKTNLVPGESLYGEEYIFVQNEDGTQVEYRLWNPLRSKLANAIMCGVTNIWVVGFQGGTLWPRMHVVQRRMKYPVFEKPSCPWKYRMVVGMVDVIYADIVNPHEVHTIVSNASFYLRAVGHYIVYTQVSNIYSTSRGKELFIYNGQRKELTPIEVVMLEPIDRAYAIAVGGFRMLEE